MGISNWPGRALAWYLNKPSKRYTRFSVTPPALLRDCLRPGDVVLVEGDLRISVAIKYLTQSTWSHAAMYVGDTEDNPGSQNTEHSEPCDLIEADLQDGVIAVPLSKYASFNTRICRPVGLTDQDRESLIYFMRKSLGMAYDLKNVVDLARYLLPTPPVPVGWRRRMLALGSGDPTRAICSTLLAQAFQSIQYPILPETAPLALDNRERNDLERELLHIRHHSLFTPRDFDISPYFRIVKPTVEGGFDYTTLKWAPEPLEQNDE
jgi:hypothetical protein